MPQIASGISKNHQKFRIIPLLYAFSFKFRQKMARTKEIIDYLCSVFQRSPGDDASRSGYLREFSGIPS